ncbi:MAG: hypothetical protein JXQ83_11740 [Candidatus Glassbacteria bacterium]|nr:hypothetical protein [Candidatus Glassbacteria bacterium]
MRKMLLAAVLVALFAGGASGSGLEHRRSVNFAPTGGFALFDGSRAWNAGLKLTYLDTRHPELEFGGTFLHEWLDPGSDIPGNSVRSFQAGAYAIYRLFPQRWLFPSIYAGIFKNLGDSYDPLQYKAGICLELFRVKSWTLEMTCGYQYREAFDYEVPGVGRRDIGATGRLYLQFGFN